MTDKRTSVELDREFFSIPQLRDLGRLYFTSTGNDEDGEVEAFLDWLENEQDAARKPQEEPSDAG